MNNLYTSDDVDLADLSQWSCEPVVGKLNDREVTLANCMTNSLITWLDREVKSKLTSIDGKLDQLTLWPPSSGINHGCNAQDASELPSMGTESVIKFQFSKDDPQEVKVDGYGPTDSMRTQGMVEVHQPVEVSSSSDNRLTQAAGADDDSLSSASIGLPATSKSVIVPANAKIGNRLRDGDDALFKRHQHAFLEELWHFLEDPESGPVAKLYANVMQVVIVSTVFVTLVQTVEPSPLQGRTAAIAETSIDVAFALEFFIRFMACPNKKMFIFHVFDVFDLVAWLVLIPRICVGFNLDYVDGFWKTFLLCFVPTLRLMKTLRRFQKLHLIVQAFVVAIEALPVLLWTMFVCVLVFSSAIYVCEPRDNIEHLPRAMWLVIVTMSTVGYGDVSPVSLEGTFVTSIVIVFSVLYMAMPIGIIGESFGHIWQDRDRILLIQQTQKRLMQWGYTAEDIPIIFHLFDDDGGGEIELPEFVTMVHEMGIGLKEDRIVGLFESLDKDGGGGIDDKEFVRQVFPSAFHRLYAIDVTHSHDRKRDGPRKSGAYVMKPDANCEALSGIARQSFAARLTRTGTTILHHLPQLHEEDPDEPDENDSAIDGVASSTQEASPPTEEFKALVPEPSGNPTTITPAAEGRNHAWS